MLCSIRKCVADIIDLRLGIRDRKSDRGQVIFPDQMHNLKAMTVNALLDQEQSRFVWSDHDLLSRLERIELQLAALRETLKLERTESREPVDVASQISSILNRQQLLQDSVADISASVIAATDSSVRTQCQLDARQDRLRAVTRIIGVVQRVDDEIRSGSLGPEELHRRLADRHEFMEALSLLGVKPMTVRKGTPFNSEEHSRWGVAATDDHARHNTVAAVLRNGYVWTTGEQRICERAKVQLFQITVPHSVASPAEGRNK